MSNMMKIIPEPSARRNAMFKVIKSNTKIAITPLGLLDCVQIWYRVYHVTGYTLQMFKVKGQRSKVKVTESKVKYVTA